jgi:hypothetical protein
MENTSQRADMAPRRVDCRASAEISAPVWIVLPFEWLFGLAFTVGPLYVLVRGYSKLSWPSGIVPVLFLLFLSAGGVWMLRRALRTMRQWRYAWGATFDICGVPPSPGGRLEGIIRHPRLGGFREVDAVFACQRESESDSRPAPSRTFNSSNALWHEPLRAIVVRDDQGAGVPIVFNIPAHLPNADEFVGSGRVFWRLEARPPLSGVVLSFDIPVLRA